MKQLFVSIFTLFMAFEASAQHNWLSGDYDYQGSVYDNENASGYSVVDLGDSNPDTTFNSPMAVLDNLIQNYGVGTYIASFLNTVDNSGINQVTSFDAAGNESFATEKYFTGSSGQSCQTNYDSNGQVTYSTDGCPE